MGTMAYEVADGTIKEYPFGLAQIYFVGEVTARRLMFGPDDAEPKIKVSAPASIRITVDPSNRTLKRLPPSH